MVGKPHEHDKRITLASDGDKSLFEKVLNAAKKAYTYLHSVGKYNAKDISEYTELINATNDVFSNALKKGIKDNVIPARMMTSLESDVFVFSALKTHAQLFEASRLLTDKNGKIKPFYKFKEDIQKIEKDYNEHYLRAEYNFATSSAQQAANWAKVEENKGRYNLQYRTAKDDKVRDSHAALDEITLPVEDKFWNSYYPPNGWNCRCVAVEVLKDKYPESDSKKAIEKGDEATMQIGKDGKNRMEIFRFNPGKEKVVFPPNHPYQPKGCGGDMSKLKGMPGIYLAANKGSCGVKKWANDENKKKEKTIREKHLELLEQNKGRNITKSFGGQSITTKFNNKDGLKHFVNDVLVKTNRITEKDLPKIHVFMKDAKPLPRIDLYKDRNDGIEKFYYLHDEKRRVIYQIAERPQFKKGGRVVMHRFLYGVVND